MVTATCNAPCEDSAFCRPTSLPDFVCLKGFPCRCSQGHNHMHIGVCSMDTNSNAAFVRLRLKGLFSMDIALAVIGHRVAVIFVSERTNKRHHQQQQQTAALQTTSPSGPQPMRSSSFFVTTQASTDTMSSCDTAGSTNEITDKTKSVLTGASMRVTSSFSIPVDLQAALTSPQTWGMNLYAQDMPGLYRRLR